MLDCTSVIESVGGFGPGLVSTPESLKLLNYQNPFRKDRGPNKSGGGVILYVKDNINVSRRDDLDFMMNTRTSNLNRTIDDTSMPI
jgi:hypothetical protein